MVKKGETLEQIAELYNIPEAGMLRDFHNKHVPDVKNTIGWALPSGVELFIPQSQEISEILEHRKNAIEERDEREWNALTNREFHFSFHFGKYYSYLVTMKATEDHQSYSFLLETEHIGRNDIKKRYILKILQCELQYSGSIPDRAVELMASDINNAFFPIRVMIDNKGFIEDLFEYASLKENWKTNKNELFETYVGKIGKKILENIDTRISDKISVINRLNLNILLALLLRSILGVYKNGVCEKTMRIKDANTICTVKNTMFRNQDDENGYYDIAQEISEGNVKISEARFILLKNDHIIEKAEIWLYSEKENIHLILKKNKYNG